MRFLEGLGAAGVIAFFLLILSAIPAYITHFIWMITTMMATDPAATGGQMVLAILGVVAPPVGVVHGWILWF